MFIILGGLSDDDPTPVKGTVQLSYNFKHGWYHTRGKLHVSACNRGFSFYTKPRLH